MFVNNSTPKYCTHCHYCAVFWTFVYVSGRYGDLSVFLFLAVIFRVGDAGVVKAL